MGRDIKVLKDSSQIQEYLCSLIISAAKNAQSNNHDFSLGLSGGSLVNLLVRGLPSAIKSKEAKGISITSWHIFLCDERLVPLSDSDNNAAPYLKLFSELGHPSEQFHLVKTSLEPSAAASDYEFVIRSALGVPAPAFPAFDLLLLGVGPDGHTCSLFPGHPALEVKDHLVVAVTDSPKPPPRRVTLTLPAVNAARQIVFVSTGESKSAILKEILDDRTPSSLPSARVKPTNGQLVWLLDEPAASKLTL